MRDLMCDAEEMAVQCYIYRGDVWDENSTTWSSIDPSKFISGQTTVKVSYANGVNQTTSHRYSFNVTNAVQAWKKGAYNKNKGLMFKATDRVESGTTDLYKTFASYNRSTYQPSITVQYASLANMGTLTVPYNTNNHGLAGNYIYPFKFTPTASDQYLFA